jgi:PAS domain-containing protein
VSEVVSSSAASASVARPESLLEAAVAAARHRADERQAALDALPAPVYVTDADGWITAFNRACIPFAGRTPVAGQDRWCVTWRLETEAGTPLPHDACPMAVAIRERRNLRGLVAAAERPDGTRVLFSPYPTLIYDEDGAVTGAVNLLVDVTDRRQAQALRAEAQRCRRLAQSITDTRTVTTLTMMAAEYEEQARALTGTRRAG